MIDVEVVTTSSCVVHIVDKNKLLDRKTKKRKNAKQIAWIWHHLLNHLSSKVLDHKLGFSELNI